MIVNGPINNQVIELLPDENDFPLENRISTLVPAISLPSVEELETKIDSLKSKINDAKLVCVSAPLNLFKEEKVKQQKAINLLEKKLGKWEKTLAVLQFPFEPSVADLEPIRVEKAFLSLRKESEEWEKTLLKVFEYSSYPLETVILKPYFLVFFLSLQE